MSIRAGFEHVYETLLVVGDEVRPFQRVQLRHEDGTVEGYTRYLSSSGDRWLRHGERWILYRDPPVGGRYLDREHYHDGFASGTWTVYHRTGQMAARGTFVAGAKAADWQYWDAQGHPLAPTPELAARWGVPAPPDDSPPVTVHPRWGGPTRRRARMWRVSGRGFLWRQRLRLPLLTAAFAVLGLLLFRAPVALRVFAGLAEAVALTLAFATLYTWITGRVGGPRVRWRGEVDDQAIHLTTAWHTTTIPVADVESVRFLDEPDFDEPEDQYWLLQLRRGGRLSIPAATVWRNGVTPGDVLPVERPTG